MNSIRSKRWRIVQPDCIKHFLQAFSAGIFCRHFLQAFSAGVFTVSAAGEIIKADWIDRFL
jgi:hypothetical protein